MLPDVSGDAAVVGTFFDTIFGEAEGYLYVGMKRAEKQGTLTSVTNEFSQKFFHWPSKREEAVQFVLESKTQNEVYFGPALYVSPESSAKANVKGAHVFWTEFDGNAPKDLGEVPPPTLRVQSSNPGHEHWYWRTEEFVDTATLEAVNHSIAYILNADPSAWDATQILRPPATFNHKRQKTVALGDGGPIVPFKASAFAHLPPAPQKVYEEVPVPESLPTLLQALGPYALPQTVIDKLGGKVKDGQDRSSALIELGFLLAQPGVKNNDLLPILLHFDPSSVKKFAGRPDQMEVAHVVLMELLCLHDVNLADSSNCCSEPF